MVRQEPAKLRTGVRFPHAPPFISLDEIVASPKILLVAVIGMTLEKIIEKSKT